MMALSQDQKDLLLKAMPLFKTRKPKTIVELADQMLFLIQPPKHNPDQDT